MDIRKLTAEQVPEAVALAKKVYGIAFSENKNTQMENFFLEYMEERKLMERVASMEIAIFGVYEQGVLAGIGGIHRPGHVTMLYVDVPFLHRGIATALMMVMEGFARQTWGVSQITANVFPSYNVRTFQKFGFTVDNGAVLTRPYLPMTKRAGYSTYRSTPAFDYQTENKKFHWKGTLLTLLVVLILFVAACLAFAFYYFL